MHTHYDPPVCLHKGDVMAAMQHHVAHGYYFWTSGEVSADKAMNLAQKFYARYAIGDNANQRAWRKRKGEANAAFFLYPKRDSHGFHWWLLATEGDGEIKKRETLNDTRRQGERLQWNGEYELALMTKKQRHKPSWSWRMTSANWQAWQVRLKKAGRSHDESLMRQAVWSLYRTPGFASTRTQVGKLLAFAKTQWRHAHKARNFPPAPPTLYYRRFQTHDKQPLSSLLVRASRARVGWFGSAKRGVTIAPR